MKPHMIAFASIVLAACGGGGGGSTAPTPPPTANTTPTAEAGADINASLSSNGISLDGSTSSDQDGDTLSFAWTVVSQPNGSSATIDNANSATPTLQTLVPGDYAVELTVTDGRGGSSSDTLLLSLQNDAPIVSIDTVETNLAIGESVTLNPTGSSDPNGHALTYSWTVSSAPPSSNLVASFNGPVPEVAFDAIGRFDVLVDVTDGYATTSETLTFEVTEFVQSSIAPGFTYLETDAQGDLVAIAEEQIVRTIDANGATLDTFNLSKTVTSLAVSPNGSWIGAAHLDAISAIRVSDGVIFGPWDVSIQPGDIITGNDGVVHTFPQTGQWVQALSVNPQSGLETSSSGGSIRHQTIAKLHPDGTKAYGANTDLSPSDIERYDLTNGSLDVSYDSPYHGEYPFSGNLWIAENGEMILAASGVVVRSTDTQSTDMTFIMQLDLQGEILHASYSSTSDQWYLVERSASNSVLNVYDGSSGRFLSSVQLPELISGSGATTVPTHVVSDPTTKTIKIFAIDHPTNPQNFAVFKRGFVDRDLLDFPPDVTVPTSVAGRVGSTIVVDASGSSDPEGADLQFSWTLDSEPNMSSIILSDTQNASIEFRPLVPGDYVFSLIVSDGERAAAPVTISVRVVEPGDGLQFRLLGSPPDIVYNKARNQIIYTSSDSEELRIVDLDDFSEQVITLPRIGERVDVSPNGDFAAVSHAGLASLIDLRSPQAVLADTQDYSQDWGDIVVDDRAIAFVIPNRDQWVDFYAFDFANDRVTSRFGARAGTQVRMHPSGGRVYAADRGLSPSDIERWTVGDIDNILGVDSRYHGEYQMSGNIWINEQGNRLIVAGGHVFRASDDPNLDMVYVDTLGNSILPVWADHSSEAQQWLTVSSNTLSLLTDTTFEPTQTVLIEPLFIDPGNLDPVIDKAFFSDAGDTIIIVGHSDNVMADNYVVQIVKTPN
ncbi:PKD domain-containing protein [Hyphomonas sp. FCG-A18]|uniref:PKD domain-containing protein n=1 Tax=Hyphomonas sp. FCG-A18 TaxID=3080019 RepID=UPI002B286862|nr:PKD domain-containing protein [Hyphomonas sp. FCG-A18]